MRHRALLLGGLLAGASACRWDWDGLRGSGGGDLDAADTATGAPVYDECLEGAAIPSGTSACVDQVCDASPACCTVGWNHTCTALVEARCERSCSGLVIVGHASGVLGVRGASLGRLGLDHATTSPVRAVAQVDLERDGDLDVGYLDRDGWTVLRNPGDLAAAAVAGAGTLTVDQQEPFDGRHLAWADWDHDGDPDLAVAGSGGVVLVRQDPDGFHAVSPPLIVADVWHLDWGDLDADGDVDLVHGSYGGDAHVTVHRNDGGGRFTRLAAPAGVLADQGVQLCDVVGSPLPDLVGAGQTTSTSFVRVHENQGGGFVATPALAAEASYLVQARCADLDGDGDLDVASNAWGDPYKVRVFRNQGGGAFDAGTDHPMGALGQSKQFDVGDVDGDGRPDLVVARNFQSVATLINQTAAPTSPIQFADPIELADPGVERIAVDLAPVPR